MAATTTSLTLMPSRASLARPRGCANRRRCPTQSARWSCTGPSAASPRVRRRSLLRSTAALERPGAIAAAPRADCGRRSPCLACAGLSRADDESPSRFAEALLGKAPPGKKLQQFLEHSSQVRRLQRRPLASPRLAHLGAPPAVPPSAMLQVLCFFCVWDDRRNLYGDRRHFKLHFFLEDGTLEVLEVATRQGDALGAAAGESGASGPAFLRRSQLPKASGSGSAARGQACPPALGLVAASRRLRSSGLPACLSACRRRRA